MLTIINKGAPSICYSRLIVHCKLSYDCMVILRTKGHGFFLKSPLTFIAMLSGKHLTGEVRAEPRKYLIPHSNST